MIRTLKALLWPIVVVAAWFGLIAFAGIPIMDALLNHREMGLTRKQALSVCWRAWVSVYESTVTP